MEESPITSSVQSKPVGLSGDVMVSEEHIICSPWITKTVCSGEIYACFFMLKLIGLLGLMIMRYSRMPVQFTSI